MDPGEVGSVVCACCRVQRVRASRSGAQIGKHKWNVTVEADSCCALLHNQGTGGRAQARADPGCSSARTSQDGPGQDGPGQDGRASTSLRQAATGQWLPRLPGSRTSTRPCAGSVGATCGGKSKLLQASARPARTPGRLKIGRGSDTRAGGSTLTTFNPFAVHIFSACFTFTSAQIGARCSRMKLLGALSTPTAWVGGADQQSGRAARARSSWKRVLGWFDSCLRVSMINYRRPTGSHTPCSQAEPKPCTNCATCPLTSTPPEEGHSLVPREEVIPEDSVGCAGAGKSPEALIGSPRR
jgi:hypothetical protein